MFTRLGLSRRLNFIILSINFIILILVAIIAYLSSSAALRNQAIDRFTQKNRVVRVQINSLFTTLSTNVENLGQSLDSLDLMESATLRSHILDYLADADGDPMISRVSVVRGDQSVAVLSFEDETNINDYQWRIYRLTRDLPTNILRQTFESGEQRWFRQVEPYFDNSAEPQPVVSIAAPFINQGENMMLWVDIPVTTLSSDVTSIISNTGLVADTEHGYVILVDQNNIPVTWHNIQNATNMGRDVQSIFNDYEAPHDNAPSSLFEHSDPFNNTAPSLYSIGHLESNDWHLIGALPVDEIPVLPNDVLAPILIVAIAGLSVLIYSVNHFVQESIVQPLTHLGYSAQEIGDGNLRFSVSHQRQEDEIGMLARALDNMRGRLKDSYDEVTAWGRTLEKRVDERTQQLALAQKRAEENAVQLRAVYDESLSVVNETQLRPVLNAFIERILILFDASYCSVWLLAADKSHIQLVATNDKSRQNSKYYTITAAIDEGLVGQTISQLQPIIVDDYVNYPHRMSLSDAESVPFHRGVCAPLMFAGQAVGAVVVGRPDSSETFSISDERYLTLFANLVSPSVRNAQLLVQRQAAIEEANRANEVKTRFLASVTHELRTPLNLIINNMDFMRVGAFGEVTDEQINRLNQTVRSSEHLLYLINDLLDVSKIEAGEMQLFIQPHEVYTLLEDTVDNAHALLETMEDKAQIKLHVEIEEDLPEIPMDARRIRQVLNNLLSNGIKFTQEGSVTLKVFGLENGIHFSVHDTGLGIPESEMDILFAAFERTTAAKQHAIEGTGLGLPISQFLVKQHGSELTVVSEVGVGSTFAFTLPYETPDHIESYRSTDTQQITAILSSHNE